MEGVVGNRQRMIQFAFVGFGIGVLILVTATAQALTNSLNSVNHHERQHQE